MRKSSPRIKFILCSYYVLFGKYLIIDSIGFHRCRSALRLASTKPVKVRFNEAMAAMTAARQGEDYSWRI